MQFTITCPICSVEFKNTEFAIHVRGKQHIKNFGKTKTNLPYSYPDTCDSVEQREINELKQYNEKLYKYIQQEIIKYLNSNKIRKYTQNICDNADSSD